MAQNIEKEIQALKRMTVGQLRAKYVDVFGEETRSHHKDFLFKRIAWRIQALVEGDLSERGRRRAEELANDADLRIRAPKGAFEIKSPTPEGHTTRHSLPLRHDRRLPMPGTVLLREYQGDTIKVMVLDNGFEYQGEVYRSLTAVAKAITGSHWNGYDFFALRKKEDK